MIRPQVMLGVRRTEAGPGRSHLLRLFRGHYEAFAKVSGPWVSLLAGGPVFFLIARWIRRRARSAAFETAMAMAGLYLAIEVAVLLAWPGDTGGVLPFMIGGMIIKVAGAWLGAGGTPKRALSKTA